MFEKVIKWWNSQYEICEGCGKLEKDNGLLSHYYHTQNYINKPLGYEVFSETIAPSTKVYFLREKKRRGL